MSFRFPFSPTRLLRSQKRLQRLIEKIGGQKRAPLKTKTAPKKPAQERLVEIGAFGSNPGRLLMKVHVPSGVARNAPLVVILHGCLQTVESFDAGAGFTKYADRRGFAVLYPQQTRSNNVNLCFNWFRPSAVARDRGELMSIRQMIEQAVTTHRLDPARIYIAGLSAGGAMALALASTYPEKFAGVAIFAGLPFGAARDAMSALSVMKLGTQKSSEEWGSIVRSASPGANRWPPLSVWQGADDRTVNPANADAILAQWLNITGLENHRSIDRKMPWGNLRRWQVDGEDQISSYHIDHFGHALPVKAAATAGKGKYDRFVVPAGISAPQELMKLWRL